MMTDDKFDEKVRDIILLQSTTGHCYTIAEYKDKVAENQTDKQGNLVFLYTTDPQKNAIYLKSAQQQGYDVLVLNSQIDTNFINFGEYKFDKVKFKGIDTDTIGNLIEKEEVLAHTLAEAEREALKSIYEKTIDAKQITWNVAAMLPEELPVICITAELLKRMEQFTQGRNTGKEASPSMHLAINGNHPLAKKILSTTDQTIQKTLAEQCYQLALLAQGLLEGALLAEFIKNYTNTLRNT